MLRWMSALALIAWVISSAAAEIYKWTDDDGEVHYSDDPPPEAQTEQSAGEAQVLEMEGNGDGGDDAARADEAKQRNGTRVATGWAITPQRIVTNHHVVAGADRVAVVLGEDRRVPARVAQSDPAHDLAMLALADNTVRLEPIPVQTAPAPTGSQVLTIGYPHVDVMGSAPKVTTGMINANRGVQDDERLYQVSTPIQAGNSGGPLFNQQGQVVGVIVGKLDAAAIEAASGDRPQNVNYAVKSQFLAPWLDGGEVALEQGEPIATEDLVAQARDSVVMVMAR